MEFIETIRAVWPIMAFMITITAGGIVWGIRLEGRVNQQEKLFELRDKYLDSRHEEIRTWMQRFDAKLDRVLLGRSE